MPGAHRPFARLVALSMLVVVALVTAGCGKKAPAEANAALDGALKALPQGDAEAFAAFVLPDQREGVTGLGEWSFFQGVKSHKIDNEFDSNVTDTTATIRTSLYFDDEQKAFSHIAFVMKKAEGKWLIDLAETIKKERDINSIHAFQVWTFEQSP